MSLQTKAVKASEKIKARDEKGFKYCEEKQENLIIKNERVVMMLALIG